MAFVLIELVGMYIGRKAGWALSRAVLYSAPFLITLVILCCWVQLVAYLIHVSIAIYQPHWCLNGFSDSHWEFTWRTLLLAS